MQDWFQEHMGKRVSIDTLMPLDKGGSYTGTVASVSADAVVLQLPNIQRLIAFSAIESAVEVQAAF